MPIWKVFPKPCRRCGKVGTYLGERTVLPGGIGSNFQKTAARFKKMRGKLLPRSELQAECDIACPDLSAAAEHLRGIRRGVVDKRPVLGTKILHTHGAARSRRSARGGGRGRGSQSRCHRRNPGPRSAHRSDRTWWPGWIGSLPEPPAGGKCRCCRTPPAGAAGGRPGRERSFAAAVQRQPPLPRSPPRRSRSPRWGRTETARRALPVPKPLVPVYPRLRQGKRRVRRSVGTGLTAVRGGELHLGCSPAYQLRTGAEGDGHRLGPARPRNRRPAEIR